MAKPPKPTRLRKPETIADVAENTKAVNDAIDDTVQCLTNGLTIGDNFRGFYLDATIQAPVTGSVRLLAQWRGKTLGTRPRAVIPCGSWQVAPSRAQYALSSPFTWDFDSGYITTDSFSGVGGTATYQMTLLVLLE